MTPKSLPAVQNSSQTPNFVPVYLTFSFKCLKAFLNLTYSKRPLDFPP